MFCLANLFLSRIGRFYVLFASLRLRLEIFLFISASSPPKMEWFRQIWPSAQDLARRASDFRNCPVGILSRSLVGHRGPKQNPCAATGRSSYDSNVSSFRYRSDRPRIITGSIDKRWDLKNYRSITIRIFN